MDTMIAIREHIAVLAIEKGLYLIRIGDNEIKLMKPEWIELGFITVNNAKVRVASWAKVDTKSPEGVVMVDLADPNCFNKIDNCLKDIARMAGVTA